MYKNQMVGVLPIFYADKGKCLKQRKITPSVEVIIRVIHRNGGFVSSCPPCHKVAGNTGITTGCI
jgi:hypothetical protein